MPATAPLGFRHSDFDPSELAAARDARRVAVCLPARNEEPTVGRVVGTIRRELVERRPLVDQVLVVDDGSVDGTAAADRARDRSSRANGRASVD